MRESEYGEGSVFWTKDEPSDLLYHQCNEKRGSMFYQQRCLNCYLDQDIRDRLLDEDA